LAGPTRCCALIQALNRQADDWGAVELARARKALARGEPAERVLEAMARGITHKMLHGAMAELNAAEGEDRLRLGDTVARLFLRPSGRTRDEAASSGPSQTQADDPEER
jgi:glutamyl-tRNA reductase